MSEPENASGPDDSAAESAPRRLPALHPHQRRVLAVLVEKAKTTPDSYPLSLNAIQVGCNQKSNRDPVMQLDGDDVLIALDGLRALEAVTEIQGGGRVSKYRHHAYDWLGVRGKHAAVMIELLLRGPQTLGEIRARASRMEKLEDLQTTTNIVNDLISQNLVMALGRPGRGQQFAHTLYEPDEMQRLRTADEENEAPVATPPAQATTPVAPAAVDSGWESLQKQIDALTDRIEQLEKRLDS
ncbi:YceH family protein [Roseimaritima sediminicola]|uniref:YceH family protein n=1 Tax=Roseimaritima sediminicola TaxID=2662066 RepID=UPI0012984A43|nr:DUF480 domain-containing protein [Roseimaritima sediminicola]